MICTLSAQILNNLQQMRNGISLRFCELIPLLTFSSVSSLYPCAYLMNSFVSTHCRPPSSPRSVGRLWPTMRSSRSSNSSQSTSLELNVFISPPSSLLVHRAAFSSPLTRYCWEQFRSHQVLQRLASPPGLRISIPFRFLRSPLCSPLQYT